MHHTGECINGTIQGAERLVIHADKGRGGGRECGRARGGEGMDAGG